MNRPLQLGLAAQPIRAGQLWGLLPLLLAALAAAFAAHQHQSLQWQVEALQARQDRLQQSLRPAPAAATAAAQAATQRRLAQALAAAEPLVVPWAQLFEALESVPTRKVLIQELVPDAAARSLRLSGQAPGLPEVLAYVERLSAQPLLGQVHLVSAEPVLRDGQSAMAFSLQASWRSP